MKSYRSKNGAELWPEVAKEVEDAVAYVAVRRAAPEIIQLIRAALYRGDPPNFLVLFGARMLGGEEHMVECFDTMGSVVRHLLRDIGKRSDLPPTYTLHTNN